MFVNYFKIKISLMRLDIKKCFVFDYEIFQMYEKKNCNETHVSTA